MIHGHDVPAVWHEPSIQQTPELQLPKAQVPVPSVALALVQSLAAPPPPAVV